MPRIAVIGAGAIGLCCAIALAETGAQVTLFDRGLPGAANSTLTGGGIRQQFSTPTNLDLSLLAAGFWHGFAERFGVDPFFRPVGYLFLAHDADQAATLAGHVDLQNRHGVDSEYLDGQDVARRWPALAGRGIMGGGFRQSDGWANQHRIIDGLVRGALSLGVDVRVGVEILSLAMRGDSAAGVVTTYGTHDADAVVMASGAWTNVLSPLGIAPPVIGRRHELLIVEPADPLPAALPWLIGIRDEVHVRPDTPGRALVGGFLGHDDEVPADDFEMRAEPAWRQSVLEVAGRVFGVVDPRARVRQGWAGLYPGTPDRHPIIDRLAPGIYAALGFSGTGLMHAPAAGRLMMELVIGGTIRSTAAGPLSANRFARTLTVERTGF